VARLDGLAEDNAVSAEHGWIIDESTLQPRLTDPAVAEGKLQAAQGADRLLLLRVLGRQAQAYDEGDRMLEALLADPSVDPWPVLLAHGDTVSLARSDSAKSQRLQAAAWREARTRSRQATTLLHIGISRLAEGELDVAASMFALAQTMRRGFADQSELAETAAALRRVRELACYDAIVLAGGTGRRLGGDKPSTRIAGWPMLDHVLLACAGASRRIVAGPRRIALTDPQFCREDPPGAGPVAAIAAALPLVERPFVAVLAADLPCIGSGLATLRDAVHHKPDGQPSDQQADVAAFVGLHGRTNYLAAVWRTDSLRSAASGLAELANARVGALYENALVVTVPDFDDVAADCDTRADLATAEQRIRYRSPGGLPVTPLAWRGLELAAPS
jgi:molybdopterin-guanine dinucleotide biosynthesis protein A